MGRWYLGDSQPAAVLLSGGVEKIMRVCSWNVNRASHGSPAWDLLNEISPDLALLQEVTNVPQDIADKYDVALRRAAGTQFGSQLKIRTVILAKGSIGPAISLSTRWDWVNLELDHFRGNLLANEVTIGERSYRVLSVYSPAWPVDRERLRGVDVECIKLKQNRDVWVTELLWATLHDRCDGTDPRPWVVGGDLNSSETFDFGKSGPRGNREILDRMQSLGLIECLRHSRGALTPTFRNPRDKQTVHQMDHLFVSEAMATGNTACDTGDHARVFEGSLSDHLPIIADFREADALPVWAQIPARVDWAQADRTGQRCAVAGDTPSF